MENLRQWTNLDTMNRNFTLQINSISRMYLQIRNVLYDLALLFTSTPAEAYSSDDRFHCVASLLPSYRTLITNFTEWEKSSYYLNFTATNSNKPRTDDFLTRLAHDIISNSNEMDRFLSELNHMLGTFRPSVDALIACFGHVPMTGNESVLVASLQNTSSTINASLSLTLAIKDSYAELSDSIRNHSRFSLLTRKTAGHDINEVIR